MKPILLIKTSGKKELFSEKKLRRSLRNAGATEEITDSILIKLLPQLHDGITTKKVFRLTRKLVKETKDKSLIGRYHLKKAIFELGPSGLPFENFVGKLLERQGYKVKVGTFLRGKCSQDHETDVVATKGNEKLIAECKFHNKPGLSSTIKTALYVKARFDDVMAMETESNKKSIKYLCWLITNTRFTSRALEYGVCSGITMISWGYPKGNALKDIIDSRGLHPVTCLSSINKTTKHALIKNGVVLCWELDKKVATLKKLRLSEEKIKEVLEEGRIICEGKK